MFHFTITATGSSDRLRSPFETQNFFHTEQFIRIMRCVCVALAAVGSLSMDCNAGVAKPVVSLQLI